MFYKTVAHKFLSKFTCNLIKKETATLVYFCKFSEILENNLQKTSKWLLVDFAQFYMSHSIIHFINQNRKKENYFLNASNRISALENYHQKKELDSKVLLFVILSSEDNDLNSFISAWDPPWNEWMNEHL